ncbi:MAG: methyltransferase [Acidiferrobacterales bacterium]
MPDQADSLADLRPASSAIERPSNRGSVVATTAFVCGHTAVSSAPLCPEVKLRLAPSIVPVWEAAEEALGATGLPPPFWAVCWVGGQALTRYLLDYSLIADGKRVLDLGSGSGLCAIAAARAGATRVEASDPDPFATVAIRINAALNAVTVHTIGNDLIGTSKGDWDVVVAGDLWYERQLAQRVTPWLRQLAVEGCEVLVGDMGRAYFPRARVTELAHYQIPTPTDLERNKITTARVWRMLP